MSRELVPLCDYSDEVEATAAAALLEESGIACVLQGEHETFNPAFTLKSSFGAIHLLVPEETVARARDLLGLSATSVADQPMEAFIANLSDDELLELVSKPDEWNAETVRAAEALLARRGRPLTPEEKAALRQNRLVAVRTPRRGDPVWMAVALIFAIGGGVFGMLIGLGYRYLKGTDPAGERYYLYTDRTRWWGGFIAVLGGISTLAWFVRFVFFP